MSTHALAVLAVIAATVIWGATFVAVKVTLAEIPPFTLALARFLVASAVLLPTLYLSPARRVTLPRADLYRLALMGFTGVTMYFIAEYLGLVYTTATSGSLIMAGVPALTAALSALFLKERIGLLRAAGIGLSFAGVALVVLAGDPGDARSANPLLGNLLVCGSVVVWAIYTILGKTISKRLPGMLITSYTIFFGTLFLVPFAAVELLSLGLGPISLQSWLIVAYLGLAASVVAYFLWNFALSHLEASVTSTFLNLLPIVSLAFTAGLLQEAVLPLQLTGGALAVAGVYVACRPRPSAVARSAPVQEKELDTAEGTSRLALVD